MKLSPFRPLAAVLLLAISFDASAQTAIRIVASNVTSGNFSAYEAPGIGILKALQPDIVLMQEFNVGGANNSAAVTAFVDSTFGPGFHWYRELDAQIPNGIVSRYPILASGEYTDVEVSNRDFAWARIDIPGPIDLYAISVHFLTTSSSNRNAEATAIINNMIPSLNIPSDAYLVLGGDFNTDNRGESCISTLSSRFITGSPYPLGQDGNGNTNAGRSKPYDWVVANGNLNLLKTSTIYGSFTYTNGLVFDTRDYSQAQLDSAFSPALTNYSGASSMQHMAVVRTFTIPASTPVSDGDSVTVGFTNRAPSTGAAGNEIPMLSATITASANEWDAGTVTLTRSGTLSDALVTPKVYLDANGNGVADAGEALLGTGGFVSGTTTISLSPAPRATPGSPVRLLMTATLGAGATEGATTQLQMTAVASSPTGGADLNPSFAAAASGTVTVTGTTTPPEGDGPVVVINKYRNDGIAGDVVELLVVQDGLDMRGMILKDFSSSMGSDGGGKYTFASVAFWSKMRAGTVIVLRNDTSAADVTSGGTDFNLDLGLANTSYFGAPSGTFDIGGTEMVMIKAAASDPAGVTDSIHALAGGTAGSQYTGAPVPKLRASTGASTGQFVYVANMPASSGASSVLSNFGEANGTATGGATGLTLGSSNNAQNAAFIQFLRGPLATAATNPGSGSFQANWTAVAGGISYLIDVATDAGFASPVTGYSNHDAGGGTSTTVSGIPAGTYYYRVRAVDVEGTRSGTPNAVTVSVTTDSSVGEWNAY